jgi:hypothetical protein
MNKPEGYVGKLQITWEDGEKNVFDVAQKDGYIWVGDHVIGPRNEKSLKGMVTEISEVFNKKARQHTWVELTRPLQFPK